MPNPIKSSDIYQDDGAIERAIEQLSRLGRQIEEVQKTGQGLSAQLKKQNVAQDTGRKQIMESAKAADRLAKEQDKLRQAYSDQEKEILRLREERKKANRQTRLEIKAANAAKGSYEQLSAQYSINKQRLNSMTQAQRDAAEASDGLVSSTKEIYEEMKRLQEETGKTSLNVGNYKDSMKDAITETFGLSGAMDILSKTPLLGVLGLIVGAVVGLFNAFTKTERGARLMEKASAALEAGMIFLSKIANDLADFLANDLYGVMVDVFTDPIGAIKDLALAIRNNLVSRFEGLLSLMRAVGSGLQALWEKDMPALKKATKEAGAAIVQFNTGLDPKEQEEYAGALAKIQAVLDKIRQDALAAKRENRELAKSLESIITQEQRLQIIADDNTRAIRERREASEAARDANERRAAIELKIAQNNLGLIQREIALRRSAGQDVENLLDEELAAFQAKTQAQREYTITLQENEKVRRELLQDQAELDLDVLIDLFDNQKTINERRLQDDRLTAAERIAIFQETVRLSNEAYEEQVATVRELAGEQIDINALVQESDARVIRDKLKQMNVSEIVTTRIIEIIKERKLATLDLAEAERDLTNSIKEAREAEADATITQLERIDQARQGSLDAFDQAASNLQDSFAQDTQEESLFERLGINEKGKEQLENSVDFAKTKFAELAQARVQAADQAVQASEREVQAAQAALQAEISAAQAGQAANVEARQEDLKAAEQQQEEALKQRQQAQRAQLAIDTVTQASSLVTAAAKILKDVPFPLNLVAVGTMFGSFAAAKIKAFQATKIFKEGGLEFLDYGGSHASGNDIFIGQNGYGSQMRAERGEAMAVINRKATSRYRSILPQVVDALNSQSFEQQFLAGGQASTMPILNSEVNVDTSRMEGHLAAIRRTGQQQYYTNSKGKLVSKRGNKTTVYK